MRKWFTFFGLALSDQMPSSWRSKMRVHLLQNYFFFVSFLKLPSKSSVVLRPLYIIVDVTVFPNTSPNVSLKYLNNIQDDIMKNAIAITKNPYSISVFLFMKMFFDNYLKRPRPEGRGSVNNPNYTAGY